MSKFQRSTMLRKLVNNSYRAIDEGAYENIWLCGPAEKAFEGTVELKE